MFTDSHCHITSDYFKNIEEIVTNAQQNGINKMINNGADAKSNQTVLEISAKYKMIYPALGIHPESTDEYNDEDIEFIEKNINNIVAIGEIGLDYHYDNSDREKQKELFERQLFLADKYNKPVIIHSRDATEDTIKLLKRYPKVRGVIHCFSGSLETAEIYLKLGYKLGIGGVITFKNSKLSKVIECIPTESIVLETDAPYLAPEPKRGKTNEPANVIFIAKYISNLKQITLDELSKITEKNIKEIFDI